MASRRETIRLEPLRPRTFDRESPVTAYWLTRCEGFRVVGRRRTATVERALFEDDPFHPVALEVRRGRRGRTRLIPTANVEAVCPVLRILYVEKPRSAASRAAAIGVPVSRVCWRGGIRAARTGGAAARASVPFARRAAHAVTRATLVALERAVLLSYKLQNAFVRAPLVGRPHAPEQHRVEEPREAAPELTGTPGYWR